MTRALPLIAGALAFIIVALRVPVEARDVGYYINGAVVLLAFGLLASDAMTDRNAMTVVSILEEVAVELALAQVMHGPMASGHEAQSVIGEEFHEFTLAVWFGVDQRGQPADPRAEAIQLAAMAVRYIFEVADRRETAR